MRRQQCPLPLASHRPAFHTPPVPVVPWRQHFPASPPSRRPPAPAGPAPAAVAASLPPPAAAAPPPEPHRHADSMATNTTLLDRRTSRHPVDEVLPAPKLAIYGFQHVLAFYAGAVIVP